MTYVISTDNSGRATVSVYQEGQSFVIDNTHPNYATIAEQLVSSGVADLDLFSLVKQVAEKFDKLSERVSIAGNILYFDNDVVSGALADQVLTFLNAGHDFAPLVKFWEKLAENPNGHSREQLYRWLDTHDFTIDTEGYIVAYKGVRDNGDGKYASIHSGPAIVNGNAVNGQVPQSVGDIVEIGRSKVQFNPSVGCSSGLHAGTWEYAKSFAHGAVLTVQIHPRDVVSVPTDCADSKMRVSRYKVTGVTEVELPALIDFSYDEEDDWDDDDEWNDDDGYDDEDNDLIAGTGGAPMSAGLPSTFNAGAQRNGNSTEQLSKRAKAQKRNGGKFSK